MDYLLKYCCLTAVSSDLQADERHDSLNHQLRVSKELGDRAAGEFVREYRIDGYSRVGYFNLSDAEEDIPTLRELIRDADLRKYDVIFMESYDRLGDILHMVWNRIKPLKIQLRSVQEMPFAANPNIYEPSKDDTTGTLIGASLGKQTYRINKIIRAFTVGNNKRARDGKYGNRVPMGYTRTVEKEAVLDPAIASLLVKFPEWLLGGELIAEIQRRASMSGINPGRGQWSHKRILDILENPFYAGKTFYDRAHNGELYDGKHEAVWTWETYLKIQEELERRRGEPRRKKTDYNFTSLIQCDTCRTNLQIGYSVDHPKYKYWYCRQGHVTISTVSADKQVTDELRRLYKDAKYTPPQEQAVRDFTDRELSKITTSLSRLEAAYLLGAYTPADYTTKKKELEAKRDELKDESRQRAEAVRRTASRQQIRKKMHEILPRIDEWITEYDPKMVNYDLRKNIKLTAHADKTITAEFAED